VVNYVLEYDEVALDVKKQILQGMPARPALVVRPVIVQGAPLPFWPHHTPTALSARVLFLWIPNRVAVDGLATDYVWPDKYMALEPQHLDEYLRKQKPGEFTHTIESLFQDPQEIPHVLTQRLDPGAHQLRVQGSIVGFLYDYEDRAYARFMQQPIDLHADFEVRAKTEIASTPGPPGTAPKMTTCGMQNYPYPGGHVLEGS
jgi:hypothetical protein